ncbi:MAG: hypothetical protein HY037_06100 [Nitrospirae bacterium]|nr:hypothetical protein [Candidatus Troglogloeales bacterium]
MFFQKKGLLAALFLILLVMACSFGKSQDRIRIVKSTPDEGTILQKGSNVDLIVEVGYHLGSAKTGTISLVVQDQDNNPITQTSMVVQEGTRRTTLAKTFTTPSEANSLFVFTPLSVQGKESSVAVDRIGFSLK